MIRIIPTPPNPALRKYYEEANKIADTIVKKFNIKLPRQCDQKVIAIYRHLPKTCIGRASKVVARNFLIIAGGLSVREVATMFEASTETVKLSAREIYKLLEQGGHNIKLPSLTTALHIPKAASPEFLVINEPITIEEAKKELEENLLTLDDTDGLENHSAISSYKKDDTQLKQDVKDCIEKLRDLTTEISKAADKVEDSYHLRQIRYGMLELGDSLHDLIAAH